MTTPVEPLEKQSGVIRNTLPIFIVGNQSEDKDNECGGNAVDNNINQHNAGWSFENISGNFDSHIQRSILLYENGHQIICHYSDLFLKPDSIVYDIECSTGQMLCKLAERHMHKSQLRLIRIDNVPDMILTARKITNRDLRMSFLHANVLDIELLIRP